MIIGKAAMVVLLVLFVRHAAEPLMTRLAGTPKLFVIFAIGWAAAAAPLGRFVGFGKELGGLAAGVSHEMSDKRTNTGTPAST